MDSRTKDTELGGSVFRAVTARSHHPHTVSPLAHLRSAIDRAAHLLPAQGPITVFIHHNTLHAFEDEPFHQAVRHGAEVFHCQPYLTEERFRSELFRGRIRFSDLRSVLESDLGDGANIPVPPRGTRLDLRLAMLQYPLRVGPAEELDWFIHESDALRKVRADVSAANRAYLLADTRRWVMRDLRADGAGVPHWVPCLLAKFREKYIELWSEETWEAFTLEALWRICQDGIHSVPDHTPPEDPPLRHRDLLLQVAGVDTDEKVNPLLVRFCAAYLDQGVSHWPLPERERGFFHAFCSLYRQPGAPPDRWMHGLSRELARLQDAGVGPLESIAESLLALGVEEAEWEEYAGATFLPLRGWAGMIHQAEIRGDRLAHPVAAGSLDGYLAARLLLERFAVAHVARTSLGFDGPLSALRSRLRRHLPPARVHGIEERAFPLFQLAQVLGWSPQDLAGLGMAEWANLANEVHSFSGIERRRVFHLAYERQFYDQSLDSLALHRRRPTVGRPRFQMITCLDEREESFRRHMEEAAPDCETFGTAGFFAVPMYYRGATDAHFVPLCPIVITPRHWVEEQVDESLEAEHRRVRQTQRMLGRAARTAEVGSRTFAFGALLTAVFGVLATVPLVLRILFPRYMGRALGRLSGFVEAPPKTRLKLERTEPEPGAANGQLGFDLTEMAASGERLLRDIGLLANFSRLICLIGHGSNSLNNPHKSAYDCGACGGSPGAPNGRAMAQILNDRRVRERLANHGIAITDDTVFVGGFHNTCNDTVTLFDTDRVPESHAAELEAVRRDIEQTCNRNAHERSRRFMSAPLTQTPEEARMHVENRSEDLAQVRPELGHASNASCIVGRRERTRGLYLDRRAFLVSYDPTQDDADAAVLTRTLQAVFPVCGGINLEYYFSHVDSPGYGCGTKLPHNITSLVGVMDGAASDLRTGLPWQMVEIHEPVRLLIVCETTPEIMRRVMDKNPMIGNMARKGWVILAVLDPNGSAIQVLQGDEFQPHEPRAERLPVARSSIEWYRGWRDCLEFAVIES